MALPYLMQCIRCGTTQWATTAEMLETKILMHSNHHLLRGQAMPLIKGFEVKELTIGGKVGKGEEAQA